MNVQIGSLNHLSLMPGEVKIDFTAPHYPDEIFCHIFSFFLPIDLTTCARLNKRCYSISRENSLWKRWFNQMFPYAALQTTDKNWYEFYRCFHCLDHLFIHEEPKLQPYCLHPLMTSVLHAEKNWVVTKGFFDSRIKLIHLPSHEAFEYFRENGEPFYFDKNVTIIQTLESLEIYLTKDRSLDQLENLEFSYALDLAGTISVACLMNRWLCTLQELSFPDQNRCTIWNLQTGEKIHSFCLEFKSPLNIQVHTNWLVIGFLTGHIQIWDFQSQCPDVKLLHHFQQEGLLCFKISDNQLFAGTSTGEVITWDLQRKQKRTIYCHPDHQPIYHLGLFRHFMVIASFNEVRIVHLGTNKCVKILPPTESKIFNLHVMPGKISMGLIDGNIIVWNFDDLEMERYQILNHVISHEH